MSSSALSPSADPATFDVAAVEAGDSGPGVVSSGHVRALSNLLRLTRRADGVRPRGSPRIVEPRGNKLVQAVALAIGSGGRPADVAAVGAFSDYNAARGTALAGVFGVERDGDLDFAAVSAVAAGHTAVLMTPDVEPDDEPARHAFARCVDRACQAAAAGGATLAQALPAAGAKATQQLLTGDCGFRVLAELIYLHQRVEGDPPVRPLPTGLTAVEFSDDRRPLFREALRLSYEGSLDCPELADLRSLDEALDGHMAAGIRRAGDWQVLVDADGKPAAVLLLAGLGMHGEAGTEVVYLGVSQRHRRAGLGGLLLDRAQAAASRSMSRLLALAVDAQNTPGLALYERRGMIAVERRTALVRDLRRARPS